jgi:hypothetical protein
VTALTRAGTPSRDDADARYVMPSARTVLKIKQRPARDMQVVRATERSTLASGADPRRSLGSAS